MTVSNDMTREDLLRLAALDLFGLLDEYESELFSRSFHNASAAVQDEVVALQAQLASDLTLLPRDEPDPGLRDKVLERVNRAIEEEMVRFAPLASIGRRRASEHLERTQARAYWRSITLWRAASFALAACLVIMIWLFYSARAEYTDLARLSLNRLTQDQLRAKIGPDFESFLENPNVTAQAFYPAEQHGGGIGSVWVNENTKSMLVLAFDLQKEGTFLIRAVNDDGSSVDLKEFVSDGFLSSIRVDHLADLGVKSIASATFQLVDKTTGNIILVTA